MSRIKCKCGHLIIDASDDLEYKAELTPDQSFYEFGDKLQEIINSLIEATKNGEREKWIDSQFKTHNYPKDLSDEEMVYDIIRSYFTDISKDIYQCEACGRILIQIGDSPRFAFFKPENERDWELVLKKK